MIPADDPTADAGRRPGHGPRTSSTSVDHWGDRFVVVTNLDAPDFRVDDGAARRPRRRGPSSSPTTPGRRITDVEPFAGHLGDPRVDRRPAAGAGPRSRRTPNGRSTSATSPTTSSSAPTPSGSRPTLRVSYQSLTTPASVLRRGRRHRRAGAAQADPDAGRRPRAGYVATRTWATASDGTGCRSTSSATSTPPSTAPRPCVRLRLRVLRVVAAPVVLASPALSLLDRGVVWALVHPRGGGELGRRWYLDGKLLAKRNTFTDTLACDRAPRRRGVRRAATASPSAAAAPAGCWSARASRCGPSCSPRRSPRSRSSTSSRTMSDPTLPLTITEWDEWGDPRDEPFASYMLGYSPYDNTVAGRAYPALYVTAGLNDPRVSYHEPAKWVAKLRSVRHRPPAPLLHALRDGRRPRRPERPLRALARRGPGPGVRAGGPRSLSAAAARFRSHQEVAWSIIRWRRSTRCRRRRCERGQRGGRNARPRPPSSAGTTIPPSEADVAADAAIAALRKGDEATAAGPLATPLDATRIRARSLPNPPGNGAATVPTPRIRPSAIAYRALQRTNQEIRRSFDHAVDTLQPRLFGVGELPWPADDQRRIAFGELVRALRGYRTLVPLASSTSTKPLDEQLGEGEDLGFGLFALETRPTELAPERARPEDQPQARVHLDAVVRAAERLRDALRRRAGRTGAAGERHRAGAARHRGRRQADRARHSRAVDEQPRRPHRRRVRGAVPAPARAARGRASRPARHSPATARQVRTEPAHRALRALPRRSGQARHGARLPRRPRRIRDHPARRGPRRHVPRQAGARPVPDAPRGDLRALADGRALDRHRRGARRGGGTPRRMGPGIGAGRVLRGQAARPHPHPAEAVRR